MWLQPLSYKLFIPQSRQWVIQLSNTGLQSVCFICQAEAYLKSTLFWCFQVYTYSFYSIIFSKYLHIVWNAPHTDLFHINFYIHSISMRRHWSKSGPQYWKHPWHFTSKYPLHTAQNRIPKFFVHDFDILCFTETLTYI